MKYPFAACAALLLGCSFDPSGVGESADDVTVHDAADHDAAPGDLDAALIDANLDAMPVPPDAEPDADLGPPPILDDIAHVADADEVGGTGDLDLGTGATIDTTALTITGATVPAGVSLLGTAQDGGGPALAILRVDDLTVTGAVRVIGNRPLVVIASNTITTSAGGVLDAGGRRDVPGAGGGAPGAGQAPGTAGEHTGTSSDSGGGGGGHGTVGNRGGNSVCGSGCSDAVGGPGGGLVGIAAITTLHAGSGGGAAPAIGGCTIPAAGAGGGSIQLYARVSILHAGQINAGGGGGGNGPRCPGQGAGASGGGSGGSIYLQTPLLTVTGGLYANGGGGGGSGGSTVGGSPGSDGVIATTSSMGGAGGDGQFAESGGTGGGSATAATEGGDAEEFGNGGGGGGASGRIAVRTKSAITGVVTASPNADVANY